MKITDAQMRVLAALNDGCELNSYPYMGSFDDGGFRWRDRSDPRCSRNPARPTMYALQGHGLVDIPPRGLGNFSPVRVTITKLGRKAVSDAD